MKKLKLYNGDVELWYRKGSEYSKEQFFLTPYGGDMKNGIPNFIFKSSFSFQYFLRGRSSAVGVFTSFDKVPLEANMFLTDMQDCINKEYNLKYLKGYFCFTKRGQNIGLRFLGEELPNSNLEVKELNLEEIKERYE